MASKWWTLALLVVLVGCGTGDSVDSSPQTPPISTTISSSTAIASSTTIPSPTTSTTTTTAAPEPPTLAITDPHPDAVVTTAVYTFQGVTDPGCTVDVGGKYLADVDADGAWTLDLVLRPGGNTTTITATDGDGGKTAVQVSLTYAPIVLSADGLGIVDFGDGIDEALAVLSGVLGPPTETIDDPEAMLAPSRGQYGFGPDATAILAIWDDLGLLVAFSDYPFYRQDGSTHLSGWTAVAPATGSSDLRTDEGIGVGSTFAEVQTAYGGRFLWGYGEEECGPWAVLRFPNEEVGADHIALWFRDLTDQGDTELVGLTGGAGPGC